MNKQLSQRDTVLIACTALLAVSTIIISILWHQTNTDLDITKQTLEATQATLEGSISEVSSLTTSLDNMRLDLQDTQSDLTSTQVQLDTTQSQLDATQVLLSTTQDNLAIVTDELAGIQDKFPLKRFSTNLALESWLDSQPNPPESTDAVLWLRHALDLQQAAADDGFLISAEYSGPYEGGTYSVWCSAVIEDGSYYWWDPDTDGIYYSLDINHF